VGLWSDLGLADMVINGPTRDITIGSHQARRQEQEKNALCLVAVGVTGNSRVDIAVNKDGPMASLCDLAVEVATLVEPKLP
jgi:hypothetical protein